MYSNPPVHGARIVANVVGDPVLFDEWRAEMQIMAGRIKQVRQKLYDGQERERLVVYSQTNWHVLVHWPFQNTGI